MAQQGPPYQSQYPPPGQPQYPPPYPPHGQPPYPTQYPPQGQRPYPPQYPPQNQPPYPPQYPIPPQYPPQYPPRYAPPPSKKGGGCSGCLIPLLIVIVVGCLILVGGGAGGYYLITNGTIDQRQILALAGKAPADANVVNLADEALTVKIEQLNPDQNSIPLVDNQLTLQPEDVDGFNIDAGTYRLSFSFASSTPDGECTLHVASDDYYQFAATSKGILVTSDKTTAKSGDDLRIETSPLCR